MDRLRQMEEIGAELVELVGEDENGLPIYRRPKPKPRPDSVKWETSIEPVVNFSPEDD